MKTLFIAAGPVEWGSSRMRAYWPAKYMQDTAVIDVSTPHPLPKAENYIFQKLVPLHMLDQIASIGYGRKWWDVCDPSWWWEPEPCRMIAENVDGVVCCTQALADDFEEWCGIKPYVIPDRLELSHFHTQRQHTDVSPVRFIWYGVAVNRISLFSAVANLERLAANGYKIELTIMDNQPEQPFTISNMFPIYHIRWTLESEVEIISSHDAALLPPYPGRWGEVKSNNKALTANACGLPVWVGGNYLYGLELCKYTAARRARAQFDMSEVDVRQSAVEWEELLCGS